MTNYRFLVFTNPVEGREEEFNRWYDDVHLPDVMKVEGFVDARRFEIQPMGDNAPAHRYLAIYELDTENPGATLAEVSSRCESGEIQLSDAMSSDMSTFLVKAIVPAGKRS